ncbi:hypothetical protein FSP39_012912 [Pinctada imbricata]|uniref:Major facilitator superfamily domain-containing protein 10 n=1 Tax=Pinctada imbricata TaxID=66713 RepID=A0AA89BYL2_PINIB|nr:hypothetical protein FSP39_012912 [Pinctada imbricata]
MTSDAMKTEQDEGVRKAEKEANRTAYIVFLSLIIDLLAFTLILPLLPSLLDYYGTQKDGLYSTIKDSVSSFRDLVGAPDTPRWNSVLFGGLIGSLFSFLQFLASPVMGAASDVYGRKPVLVISMIGVALSYALWAISHNFTLFVFARIVGGLSKGNVSLSTAVVADIFPPEKRGRGMALIGVAFSVGFVFGPLIGAGFSVYARQQQEAFYTIPALFALTLAVIDIIFISLFFKETLPQDRRAKSISSGWQKTSHLINPISLFKFSSVEKISKADLSSLQHIGSIYFLYLLMYSGLEFTLTFLVHNRLSYNSMQQGRMFFYIGTVMALVQGGYVRRIPAGKETKIATMGLTLLIPAFIMMAFAQTAWLMYLGLTLFAFASATVVPCLTTMVSSYGGTDQKGVVTGVFRSLGALARALGPVIFSTELVSDFAKHATNGRMGKTEVRKFLQSQNLDPSEAFLEEIFSEHDKDKNYELNEEEFRAWMKDRTHSLEEMRDFIKSSLDVLFPGAEKVPISDLMDVLCQRGDPFNDLERENALITLKQMDSNDDDHIDKRELGMCLYPTNGREGNNVQETNDESVSQEATETQENQQLNETQQGNDDVTQETNQEVAQEDSENKESQEETQQESENQEETQQESQQESENQEETQQESQQESENQEETQQESDNKEESQLETQQESENQEETQQETEHQEETQQESENQEESQQETENQEETQQETEQQEETQQESGNQEEIQQETENQVETQQESGNQEETQQESENQEETQQEETQQESGNQEETQQESENQEGTQQDSENQEGTQQESGNQEGTQQESENQEESQQESENQEESQQESENQEGTQHETENQEGTENNQEVTNDNKEDTDKEGQNQTQDDKTDEQVQDDAHKDVTQENTDAS